MTKYIVLLLFLACAPVQAAVDPARDIQRVMPLMKEGRMEEVSNLFHRLLETGEVPAAHVMYYYYGALWLSQGMQDNRRALTLAQLGIDRCQVLASAGTRDTMIPGDSGVFFQRCSLLRAKAQILARMGKLDDAKAAAGEAVAALRASFDKPEPGRNPWASVMNLGQTVVISNAALPVIRAAFDAKGPEEAARHLDWVLEKLSVADAILDWMAGQPGMMKVQVEDTRRILGWARAEALVCAGQHAKALELYARWSPDPGGDLSGGKGYLGYPLMLRALALARTGKRAEAYRDLDAARALLAAALLMGNLWTGPNAWMPDWQRGKMLEEEGKSQEAVAAYRDSLASLRPLYDKIKSSYARREFLRESDQVYGRLVRLLLGLGKVDEALDRLEESHSKGLLDLMEDSLNENRRGWSPELKARSREIKRKLLELDGAPGSGEPGKARSLAPGPGPQRAQRMKLMSDYEQLLHSALELFAPQARAQAAPARWRATLAGKASARARLESNDRFRTVMFLVASDPCWVVVCGGGKSQAFKLAASKQDIRKTARALRKAITGHADDWQAAAKDLHRMVLEPAAPALAGASRVVMVPDGELWYVPFGCLLRADGSALAESFEIGVLSSLTLAASLLDHPPATGAHGLRVFADPDGSLPAARKEGQQIAMTAKGAELLVGPDATEQRLKNPGGGARQVVHLATHGVLDAVNPLYSYLVMAAGAGEDGRLQVSEIGTELELAGTPLAVLSACNTAVGDVSGGNEMVCLQQAFHEAGVPGIVASLWEVSDEWTAALMKALYQELASGAPPAQALARAMRALAPAKAGAARYQEPYRWSAFQYYGLP